MKFNNKTVLEYVIEGVAKSVAKSNIYIATSDQPSDDVIEDFCNKMGYNIFRGDLDNVAYRFLECAKNAQFDFAFRINGDNIFIDNELLNSALNGLLQNSELKFISNVKNRTFPKGMSIEGVNVEYYEKSYSFFIKDDLEHVMTYFYRNTDPDLSLYIYNTIAPELAGIQLALDTKEDAKHIADILGRKSGTETPNLTELAKILKKS